jgi:hypothetical protein
MGTSWANVTSQFVVGDTGHCYHQKPVFNTPLSQGKTAVKKVIGSVSVPAPSIATTTFSADNVFGIQLTFAFVLQSTISTIDCAAAKNFSVTGDA